MIFKFVSFILALNTTLAVCAAEDLSACENLHNSMGYPPGSSKHICKERKERVKKSNDPEVIACAENLQKILKENKMDVSLSTVCFHAEGVQKKIVLESLDCLKRYDSILSPIFWINEEAALHNKQTFKDESLLYKMIQQCAMNPEPAKPYKPADDKAVLLSRTIFHTLTPAAKGLDYNLGGLSGLTIAPDKSILAISDDRSFPSLHSFSIREDYKIEFKSSRSLFGPYTDLEDLALDEKGQLIVTSEEIPGRTYVTNSKEKSPKGYIFRLNEKGDFIDDIEVPSEFYSRTLELDALCGKKDDGGFIASITEVFTGSKRKKIAGLSEDDREKCKDYSQAEGIRYNRGIESLFLDKTKNILYFMPEQPLQKKNGIEKTVPLVIHDLMTGFHQIRDYPLDLQLENGIVSLLKTGSNTLLILERGFDPVQREAVVKLYRTKIPTNPSELMTKNLLLDFKTLVLNAPLGLSKVDNFEGMTLGPVTKNGKPTLIFVSDNNMSLKQKTDFLVVEVPNQWLQ